jgi:hypothetical protein
LKNSKSITTLIKDIQARLVSPEPFKEEDVSAFSHNLAQKLANRLAERKESVGLRLSNLGTRCQRKLWYTINRPELAEPLSASTRFKFLFGDIIEEVVLFLARTTGHRVESEQAEVEINGVKGHIDGVVDGELVDVKSASSYSFKKFKEGGLKEDDPFGYLTQIGAYHFAKVKEGEVNKDRAHFIAVDKTLGHLTLDTHQASDVDFDKMVDERRKMLKQPEPPERGYLDEADGMSGNRKLCIACSYCPFKNECWKDAPLRTFAYSRGPVFLTKVVRQPNVPEITGNVTEE